MLARTKVSSSTAPALPLHSHTQQNYTKTKLQGHEKLRRLGEATTDVFCAGIEALFDKWGTQRMSQRMQRVTKSVQGTSTEIFQAPYARLHALYLEQQARVEELSAHLSGEKTLPQKLSEQSSLIDQLRDQIPALEHRINEQQQKIRRLEEQLDASMVHEDKAREQAGIIATLTGELESLRSKVSEQQGIIDELRSEIVELEGLRDVISARDAAIDSLRAEIAEDKQAHEAQVAAHEKAVADMQNELLPLRAHVQAQVARIAELSAEAEAGKTHEARVAEQEAMIRDLREMLAADKLLETKVQEQDALLSELRGAIAASESEISYQKEHSALLQKELSGVETQLTSVREHAGTLEKELQDARARIKEMESSPRPSSGRATPTRRPTQPLPWYMQRYSSTGSTNGA